MSNTGGGKSSGATYLARDHYRGEAAEHYDSKRADQLSWGRERDIVEKLCAEMPRGSRILDIPSGTGRFFPLFHRYGQLVWGSDISTEMMLQVPTSNNEQSAVRGMAQADAEALPFVDGSFEYVVCIRFFHLDLPESTGINTLKEFARVANRGIILHIPFADRSTFQRVADGIAEIYHAGARAPAEAMKKAKRAFARGSRSDKGGPVVGSVLTSADGRPFSCSEAELEALARSLGFTVTRSYGAVSPFSSKRICLLEKLDR